MDEEVIAAPTPEEIAQWERDRANAEAAVLAPARALHAQLDSSDAYLIDLDYRTCMIELFGGALA